MSRPVMPGALLVYADTIREALNDLEEDASRIPLERYNAGIKKLEKLVAQLDKVVTEQQSAPVVVKIASVYFDELQARSGELGRLQHEHEQLLKEIERVGFKVQTHPGSALTLIPIKETPTDTTNDHDM